MSICQISLSTCIYLSVCLSVCLPASLCRSVCLYVCLSTCLSASLYLSVRRSVRSVSHCLSVHLPAQSVCLHVCLSVCLPNYSLSFCLNGQINGPKVSFSTKKTNSVCCPVSERYSTHVICFSQKDFSFKHGEYTFHHTLDSTT